MSALAAQCAVCVREQQEEQRRLLTMESASAAASKAIKASDVAMEKNLSKAGKRVAEARKKEIAAKKRVTAAEKKLEATKADWKRTHAAIDAAVKEEERLQKELEEHRARVKAFAELTMEFREKGAALAPSAEHRIGAPHRGRVSRHSAPP